MKAGVKAYNGMNRIKLGLNSGPTPYRLMLARFLISLNLNLLICTMGITTFQIHNPVLAILKPKELHKMSGF